MVEVSTSILGTKKGEESKTFFALEVAKTDYFKKQLKEGKTLDDILPEAFDPKVTDVVAKAVMDLIK